MNERKNYEPLPIRSLDDLFSTQEQRNEARLVKIHEIPLNEIDGFPEHPFKVLMNEDMEALVESIKERGVISPAVVRRKENGRYELVSGHRRKKACELAGLKTLRCEIVDVSREEAVILMVDSNLAQRTEILPSEKAFAYKMRLDAMKKQQGFRSDLTSATVLQKSNNETTREKLAGQIGESHEQIRKYIRLTKLIPELLKIVDEGKLKLRPAVEISYLNEECQRALLTEIELCETVPSTEQTKRMRKFFEQGKLTEEGIQIIMSEEKPDKPTKYSERVRKFIPRNIPKEKTEDYICQALQYYGRFLDAKKRSQDAR